MKKSALALAVAAALGVSAAQAESRVTTLYGSARVSVDWNKTSIDNDVAEVFNIDNNPFWEVFNNASRLGVIGAEDLGSGWSAFYQYEFGVNVTGSSKSGQDYWDQSNRPRLVGLKSDFGALSLGTQYTPFYNVLGYTDTFNDSKTFGNDYFLGSTTGNNANNIYGIPIVYSKGIGAIRRGKSVVYSTPNWDGLSAQGMLVMDGHPPGTNNTTNRSPDAIDSWEANLTYKNGPWFLGGAYLNDRAQYYGTEVNGEVDRHSDQQYGVAGGWDNKQVGVGLKLAAVQAGRHHPGVLQFAGL